MLKREEFKKAALQLIDFCEVNRLPQIAAVGYKVLFCLLDRPYNDEELTALRQDFLYSDIVEELFQEQDRYGGWGSFNSKDYSVKAKFPTSVTAINRCLYIGLTMEDRNILFNACEYLEDFLKGTAHEKIRNSNERVVPWNTAKFCELIEAIKPYNPLCDQTYFEWQYIAGRAFESGEYSYERERAAQHEVFHTREDRLVPMQTELLLKRRDQIPIKLEDSMLRHYGEHAYYHGYFWQETPTKLPDHFVYHKTRRWLATFNYINQFRGSAIYLADSVDWLMGNQNSEGLWDWGTQVKDPWGYFGYFSTNRNYLYNRIVDCTMEILSFLKTYIDHNE
ncbi:MAG TPA: hypothetical protein DDZ89_07780 [Clostridiales bacterium]|nr:hypothetical protein [Clostridiales bacterium]